MNHRWFPLAALPAALLFVEPAVAADSPATEAPSVVSCDTPASSSALELAPLAEAPLATLASWNGTTLEAIRYRPRRWRDRDRDRDRDRGRYYEDRGSRASGFSQIHGGFFDPDGEPPSAMLFGVRAGANLDDVFQLGFGLDWSHRSDRSTVVTTDVPLPGGGTAQRQTVLAQSSSNLVPMMAFLQLSPGVDLPVAPYFGLAGGYQVLFLDAENFETGEQFEATYDGWGWQLWGGATMPLSGRTRLAAEVFWNEADLDRDVDDPSSGRTLREVIPQEGLGMRFGLSWGF
jgi:hypothetical protein